MGQKTLNTIGKGVQKGLKSRVDGGGEVAEQRGGLTVPTVANRVGSSQKSGDESQEPGDEVEVPVGVVSGFVLFGSLEDVDEVERSNL